MFCRSERGTLTVNSLCFWSEVSTRIGVGVGEACLCGCALQFLMKFLKCFGTSFQYEVPVYPNWDITFVYAKHYKVKIDTIEIVLTFVLVIGFEEFTHPKLSQGPQETMAFGPTCMCCMVRVRSFSWVS